MGGCAPIYHARWRIATKSAGALCGGSLKCMLVSRFLANPIQMNFAENQKRPTSAAWRRRPTQECVGSMRAGIQAGSGSNPNTATAHCTPGTLSDRQPLCDSSGGFEELLARRGPRSGRRLPRNRLLRLHGVLELLRGDMGSGLLPPKNGFCG